jgi:hypothetical protein
MSAFRQHAEGQPRCGGSPRSGERCTDRPLEPRPTLREQPDTNNSVARGWNRDTLRRYEASVWTTPFTAHSKPTVDWGRNRGDKFNGSLTYSGIGITKWRRRHTQRYSCSGFESIRCPPTVKESAFQCANY